MLEGGGLALVVDALNKKLALTERERANSADGNGDPLGIQVRATTSHTSSTSLYISDSVY